MKAYKNRAKEMMCYLWLAVMENTADMLKIDIIELLLCYGEQICSKTAEWGIKNLED